MHRFVRASASAIALIGCQRSLPPAPPAAIVDAGIATPMADAAPLGPYASAPNDAGDVADAAAAEPTRDAARAPPPLTEFETQRALHPTRIVRHGPSPQPYDPWPKRADLRVLEYDSGALRLKGLFAEPRSNALTRDGKSPLLIYLHGGFALGANDVDDCAPFLRAGFAVWAPAYRGENGNPGDHELLWGELDDARAAIAFARTLPVVDPDRVALFGHSAGGMLTSLLALRIELPVVDTGSAGGLYSADLFDTLPLPFADSPLERRLRLFAPFAAGLKHPHFACAGSEDFYPWKVSAEVETAAKKTGVPFVRRIVPGGHYPSVKPCMEAYLARVMGVMLNTK